MNTSVSSNSSGKSSLRFVLGSPSYKFRIKVNLEVMSTINDLKDLVRFQLEKKLKIKMQNDDFTIKDSQGFQLEDHVDLDELICESKVIRVELSDKMQQMVGDSISDTTSQVSMSFSQIADLQLNSYPSSSSLSSAQNSPQTIKMRIVNSDSPETLIHIKLKESQREVGKLRFLQEKLKIKLGAPAQGLRIVFFDQSGIPYSSGIDVINFISNLHLGGEQYKREVLAVLTPPTNDIQSLLPVHPQSGMKDTINVTIYSFISTESTASKIPVDLDTDKFKDFLKFVSYTFNIPTS